METMKVQVAKFGTSIQTVEIPTGSNVMTALRAVGYNLDTVVSIKRNGAAVAMDSVLSNEDVLLVAMDKLKGGMADEETTPVNVLRVAFTIQKESQSDNEGKLLFTDDMSTFEIVKQVMMNKGLSLNVFKELRNETNEQVTFSDKLKDGDTYKIVITDSA